MNLEHIGHKVLRAASAEEAEAAIRAALPDVLVLDWMLPGESGLRSRGACAPTSARASCRSSCSPRAPWSKTRSRGSRAARTITSPSPFPRRSSPRASRRCSAARAAAFGDAVEAEGLGSIRPPGVHRAGEARRAFAFRVPPAALPDDAHPGASTPARSSSTTSGAITCSSRSAPSTFTSAACARRSSRAGTTG